LSDADIIATVKDLTEPKKAKSVPIHYDEVDLKQMSLFDTTSDDNILAELEAIDVGNLTPLEALKLIDKLQNQIKNRWR